MKKQPWLIYAIITTLFWGVWGAFIEIPEKSGFPATLGYVVWAMTMIPCAIFALNIIKWKLDVDMRSVLLGSTIGLLGAGGQIILFHALVKVPAYLVFPIISLYPVVTVILSVLFLKERTNKRHWYGIVAALFAILMLSYQGHGNGDRASFLWLLLPVIIFLLWGIQAFVMKFSNETMKAESIFFYMMVTGVLLIPVALMMTDFNQEINWGFKGPYLAAMIQVLNALGALTLVYALRFGKAIIVVPLTALAPVITVILSLIIYAVIPHVVVIAGMVLTAAAIYLLAE